MRIAPLLLLLVTLGAAETAAELPADGAPPGVVPGEIAVEVTGFRSDKGLALVALYTSAKGFPDHPELALQRKPVAIQKRTARTVFRRLPPGTYAISVLHDEDGNHKIKTGLFGIPKEGYGASRDARGKLGPPRFEDARLSVGPGQKVTAAIRIVYH